MSKQEDFILSKLTELYPSLYWKRNLRPNFLKNPLTGNNLEIDFWNHKYKIGIEYQGNVHFRKIPTFKNNPDHSRRNDMNKQELIMKYRDRAIIELFDTDLSGDFEVNLFARISNTISYFNYSKPRRYISKIKVLNKFLNHLKYLKSLRDKSNRIKNRPFGIDWLN